MVPEMPEGPRTPTPDLAKVLAPQSPVREKEEEVHQSTGGPPALSSRLYWPKLGMFITRTSLASVMGTKGSIELSVSGLPLRCAAACTRENPPRYSDGFQPLWF